MIGDSSELFMKYFREVLNQVFRNYPDCMNKDVPEDFAMNHVTGSFSEAVRWWIRNGMKVLPEELVKDYLRVIGYSD